MRTSACWSRDYFKGRCRLDIETQAILNQLKRKARLLVSHTEQMGFFNVKQQGEELVALLEMLERKIQK